MNIATRSTRGAGWHVLLEGPVQAAEDVELPLQRRAPAVHSLERAAARAVEVRVLERDRHQVAVEVAPQVRTALRRSLFTKAHISARAAVLAEGYLASNRQLIQVPGRGGRR